MSLAAESLVTLPLTFKAIGAAAPGAPFEPVSRTVNVLAADEVLVKVSYASINPMDVKIYQSNFAQLPLPMVRSRSLPLPSPLSLPLLQVSDLRAALLCDDCPVVRCSATSSVAWS